MLIRLGGTKHTICNNFSGSGPGSSPFGSCSGTPFCNSFLLIDMAVLPGGDSLVEGGGLPRRHPG